MKVSNKTSKAGNRIANQFIITDAENNCVYFQSYDSIIAKIDYKQNGRVYLDEHYWDYSQTTSKYRNIFLGGTTKDCQSKIDSGEYKLINLNK